jgi:hypothetical protein
MAIFAIREYYDEQFQLLNKLIEEMKLKHNLLCDNYEETIKNQNTKISKLENKIDELCININDEEI